MLTRHGEQHRGDVQLDLTLTGNIVLEATVVTAVGVAWLTLVRSPWLLLIMAVVALYGLCVWWARRLNRRGRVVAAVVWASVGYVPVGFVNALVAPFSLPLLVLAALIPALLSVPYLPRRGVAALTSVTIGLTLLVCIIATFSQVSDIQDQVSPWVRDLILILGVPAIAALVVLIEWHNHLTMSAQSTALTQSRDRLAAAADAERARVERRLQGGVQQRLLGASDAVDLAGRHAIEDPIAAQTALDTASVELRHAVDELRGLAQGLYPAVLAGHGLADALAALADRSGTLVDTNVEPGRYDATVEIAVYFCCAEALENIELHAGPGAQAWVDVHETADRLRFVVRDDGVGFEADEVGLGAGLRLLSDRVLVLDGTLSVESTPGVGTVVSGEIPLARTAAPVSVPG